MLWTCSTDEGHKMFKILVEELLGKIIVER
jgi:hypothetical protein